MAYRSSNAPKLWDGKRILKANTSWTSRGQYCHCSDHTLFPEKCCCCQSKVLATAISHLVGHTASANAYFLFVLLTDVICISSGTCDEGPLHWQIDNEEGQDLHANGRSKVFVHSKKVIFSNFPIIMKSFQIITTVVFVFGTECGPISAICTTATNCWATPPTFSWTKIGRTFSTNLRAPFSRHSLWSSSKCWTIFSEKCPTTNSLPTNNRFLAFFF